MHLYQLLNDHAQHAVESVPDWMIGCFKRKSITFADGRTDAQTIVFWLQGRNLTVDLRLPITSEQVKKESWQECTLEELRTLADYEAWSADSIWENNQMRWSGGVTFQLHNRWPEPAVLSRVGDCMIEFSPQGAYVEDWRNKTQQPGILVSLKLVETVNLTTNRVCHQGGALVITGDWAALVLGRSEQLSLTKPEYQLRDEVINRSEDSAFLDKVFNFETSVAKGNLEEGFEVAYSTCAERIGQPLTSLDGFEFDTQTNELIQIVVVAGATIKRRFVIDALENKFMFSKETSQHLEAQQWFAKEQQTLSRYLGKESN